MSDSNPETWPSDYSSRMRLVLESDGHPCAKVVVIRRDGQSDQQAQVHADEVGRTMAASHVALVVLTKLVERAEKVADSFPGKDVSTLLDAVATIEVPTSLVREAMAVLEGAGRRPGGGRCGHKE